MNKSQYYNKLLKILEEGNEKYSKEQDVYEAYRVQRESRQFSHDHVSRVIIPKQTESKKRLEGIRNDTNRKIAELTAATVAEIEKEYSISPERLTDDFRILSCGLPLTLSDLELMRERNENNGTMKRLISRYVEAHKNEYNTDDRETRARVRNLSSNYDEALETNYIKQVDGVAKTVAKWFGNGERYENIKNQFFGENSEISQYFNS